MISFESYFTFEKIVQQLCKYRVQTAKKRHKLHLIRDVSLSEKSLYNFKNLHPIDELFKQILPPRRQWLSIKKDDRIKYKSSPKLQQLSLYRTVIKVHINPKQPDSPAWYFHLLKFVENIQKCVDPSYGYSIKPPKIKPQIKERANGRLECRPLAEYEYFDRIIISLTARYLTDLFDNYLVDNSSFAFRSTKNKPVKNHHSTITEIRDYIVKNANNEIWVAECDLRKFFDCVNHDVAKDALNSFIKKAEAENRICDTSAMRIFDSYLSSYNYLGNVYALNEGNYFKKFKIGDGHFPLPIDDLKKEFYSETSEIKIGVPQGGAISCLIVNLILHYADEAVLRDAGNSLRYLRFCDDMIILSDSQESCSNALTRYNSATKHLKLLTHPPVNFDKSDFNSLREFWEAFWKGKSRAAYRLSKGFIPWLSFVGYQVRYDGIVRIRKASIRKEIDKQRNETNRILKALHAHIPQYLNANSRKSLPQQVAALERRLISMSVGRISLHNSKIYEPEYCWIVGFQNLVPNHAISTQLKNLDRERNRHLHQFKRRLGELTKDVHKPDTKRSSRYCGSPFSYFHQIQKKSQAYSSFMELREYGNELPDELS